MDWKNPEIPFDSLSELAYIIADYVIESAIRVVTEGEQPRPIKSVVLVVAEGEQPRSIKSTVQVVAEGEQLRVIKSAAQVVTEQQPKEAGISGSTFEIFKRVGNPPALGTKPYPSSVAGDKYEVRNIKWMMCKDYTTVRGLLQIEEYVKVRRRAGIYGLHYLQTQPCWNLVKCRPVVWQGI